MAPKSLPTKRHHGGDVVFAALQSLRTRAPEVGFTVRLCSAQELSEVAKELVSSIIK